jgi:hypothetical protein
MQRVILAVLTSAAFGSLATTGSRAMPIASAGAPSPHVQVQANRVCNAEGWCWFLPYHYHRPTGIDTTDTTNTIPFGLRVTTIVPAAAVDGIAAGKTTTSSDAP